jgi:hypothetical protein
MMSIGKKILKGFLCCLLLIAWVIAQADEPEQRNSHLVDMADGLNSQAFMNAKNPDALWSSSMLVPWTRTNVIKAYENGQADSKITDTDQLVNIRVMYGLDLDHTRASFSPSSAQNELFRQMARHCSAGFQKVGEWSELVENSDYYLYYQFQCIDKTH